MKAPAEMFDPRDPELLSRARHARRVLAQFNAAADPWSDENRALLTQLLGAVGEGAWIEAPFFCEYGHNVRIGAHTFVNTGVVLLDAASITIGARVLIAPRVQLLTVTHPLDPAERCPPLDPQASGAPYVTRCAPIVVEDEVWLGAGAIIMPGVRIGRGSTVGAGAVVTRDVPVGVLVTGVPARVVRAVTTPSALADGAVP